METVGFLAPFVLIGVAVLFIAFSGGPGRAREIYLTRGGTGVRLVLPVLYVGLGIALPAAVIVDKEEGTASTPQLAREHPNEDLKNGKNLFLQTCASCHSLEAVGARGVTGPSLDELGGLQAERVLGTIERGGTGQKRMPAALLEGENARDVAAFVAKTARK